MTNVTYTDGDLARMTHAVQPLLKDKYSLFKQIRNGKWSATATYTDRPCSILLIARLVPTTGLQGESETAPTRFMMRINRTDTEIKARDRVTVTNRISGEVTEHTVESVRWPNTMPIWKIADLSDPQ